MLGAARFLKTLHDTPDEDGGTLLDSTVTLIGSAMGDAAAHRRTNYPLFVAGADCSTSATCRAARGRSRTRWPAISM